MAQERVTSEKLLEELSRVDEIVDGNTRSKDFEKHTDHSTTTLQRRFGTFNNAKIKAGVRVRGVNTGSEYSRRRVNQVKERVGCSLCGYDNCVGALEFHHTDPSDKVNTVALMATNYHWREVLKEMKKCVILCSNCHREVENEVTSLADAEAGGQ